MAVRCYVCEKPTPPEFVHRHHAVPQSTGAHADNSEENVVLLDGGCHHNLHILGTLLLNGKTGQAVDLAESYYDNAGATRRVLKLAELVAKETIAMREGERDLPAMVMVSVELPREAVTMLKIMSLEERGHRQFAPFLRDMLLGIAAKAQGPAPNQPPIEHITYKG